MGKKKINTNDEVGKKNCQRQFIASATIAHTIQRKWQCPMWRNRVRCAVARTFFRAVKLAYNHSKWTLRNAACAFFYLSRSAPNRTKPIFLSCIFSPAITQRNVRWQNAQQKELRTNRKKNTHSSHTNNIISVLPHPVAVCSWRVAGLCQLISVRCVRSQIFFLTFQ